MQEKCCPYCKTKLSDFYRTSMLGCSHCYDSFKQELLPYINKVQGKTYHIGKIPDNNFINNKIKRG